MRIFFILSQLSFLLGFLERAKLYEGPINMAVTVGHRMEMTCKVDSVSNVKEWKIHRPLSNNETTIWANWNDVPRLVNDHFGFYVEENKSSTIYSNSTQLNDAGIYTCVVDMTPKQPNRYSANLVVFESEPQCKSNISAANCCIEEFDYIELRCAVNYSGHWTPSMQWSITGKAFIETPIVINSNKSHLVQQLSSVIILQVGAEDNGATITFKIWFSDESGKAHNTNATNAPDYSFNWNNTLNVFFGPRNVTISPQKDIYRHGDVLNCMAEGNPSPLFAWRDARTKEKIADGRHLALKKTGLDANQRYSIECVAENKIKQSSEKIDVYISESSGNSNIIIFAGIICVILLLIVIIVGRKRIQGIISTQTNSPNENPQSQSPDYESIHEAEINASPSTSTTQETAARAEDVFDGYTALTERPVVLHHTAVYCSLIPSSRHVEAIPAGIFQGCPLYANVASE